MDMETTVFLIDDDPAMRELVCGLAQTMNLRFAAFNSGEEFVEAYDPSFCGCLITEVRTSGLSGPQLQRFLADRGVTLPVIFASSHGDLALAVRALRNGAVHFLEKPVHTDELWDALQEAIQRDCQARAARVTEQEHRDSLGRLTAKERHVLAMVVRGKKNRSIAANLGISIRTVELHRAKLMKKLKVRSLTELLRFALHVGDAVLEEGLPQLVAAGSAATVANRAELEVAAWPR